MENTLSQNRLQNLAEASDFALKDTQGNTVRLSDFRGKQPVVLVMTRGFV
jgi:peroxiredoxin